jgi:hypothetical protein
VVGLAIGVIATIVMTYRVELGVPPQLHSRRYNIGTASINVLIDTPKSQVTDISPPAGTDSLDARSTLLASLLAAPPARALIAKRAGISAGELKTVAASSPPLAPTQVAKHASQMGVRSSRYHLTLTAQPGLSILGIVAEGPDASAAERVANAAFLGLHDYVDTVAAEQGIPSRRRPVIRALGAASAADVVRGPRRLSAAIAGLVAFVLVCSAVVILAGLRRRWRASDDTVDAGGERGHAPIWPRDI